MENEKNQAIVKRMFDELWHGASQMETLEELIAPDHVFHFGKASETWVYADNLGMLMQLGAVNLPT